MALKRALAVGLMMTMGLAPLAAQQAVTTGTISGKAVDEAKKPYSNYVVQLRDISTGQIVSSQTLDPQGLFSFTNIELSKRYLVELYSVRRSKVVCSEGPYALTAPSQETKADVNIDCGATPAALWLLAAGAGTAAAVVTATASGSK
ncbi:MAG TPA: hypothetical protein VHD57_08430 [Vicinamibacterales bacterium]|jgi:hypothetical protein|nr:hypothetical protein [Vicinamibacterales bacterium]